MQDKVNAEMKKIDPELAKPLSTIMPVFYVDEIIHMKGAHFKIEKIVRKKIVLRCISEEQAKHIMNNR